jgi:hypothetical protein
MPESKERTCDGCTLCCKLVASPELDKPCGTWCALCEIGVGCREYAARPPSCRNFRCMWLADPDGVPEGFRPDKVKAVIVMSNDEVTPAIFCDRTPTGAFRRWLEMHSYARRILLMNSRGVATKLIVSGKEYEVDSERIDINTMRWNPKP